MASSIEDTIQHATSAPLLHSYSAEKPTDTDHLNEGGTQKSTEDSSATNTSQYTPISQLWTTTTSSFTRPSDASHLHDVNKKPSFSSSDTQSPPLSTAQQALQRIFDEPREPGFKYKGSATSRGTHRDYPPTRDALWTGDGNRAVPEGLMRAAASGDGGGQDGSQSTPPGGDGSTTGTTTMKMAKARTVEESRRK